MRLVPAHMPCRATTQGSTRAMRHMSASLARTSTCNRESGPLVGSNASLLGRDVTYTSPKGPDVLVGNIPAHTGAIDQELSLLAHAVYAPSTGTYAMPYDHTRVHMQVRLVAEHENELMMLAAQADGDDKCRITNIFLGLKT